MLGFDFSLYRIQPTGPANYTPVNPRPEEPEAVAGTLRIAAMNTLNFFLTLDQPGGLDNTCGGNQNLECRGADSDQPMEFTRQRDKLLSALAGLDADVIGLNELENTPGVDPLGDPSLGIVAGLNSMLGPGTYEYIDTGVIGTDAIRVGLIYKPAQAYCPSAISRHWTRTTIHDSSTRRTAPRWRRRLWIRQMAPASLWS